MKPLKTQSEIQTIVNQIEAELDRLGWLATDDQPCDFVVAAEDLLPNGWVKLAADSESFYGDGEEMLSALETASSEDEFGSCLSGFAGSPPTDPQSWPDDLCEDEQVEHGSMNDDPLYLYKLGLNSGIRYIAGPTGVSRDGFLESFDYGEDCFFETEVEAVLNCLSDPDVMVEFINPERWFQRQDYILELVEWESVNSSCTAELIKECFNCHNVEILQDGNVIIADPQKSHLLSDEQLDKFVAWHTSR